MPFENCLGSGSGSGTGARAAPFGGAATVFAHVPVPPAGHDSERAVG